MANNKNKLSNVHKIIKDYEEHILENENTLQSQKAEFKIYEKLIINSINQTAGGTKPRVVGQMSDLVPKFRDYCIKNNISITSKNWKKWYLDRYLSNFENSLSKLKDMLEKFKKAINEINDKTLEKWLNNFLFIENIGGLLIQDIIMNYIKTEYPKYSIRAAIPSEESKNIDIIINNKAYQVKPLSIKQGTSFNQQWGDEQGIWYKEVTHNKKPAIKLYIPKLKEKK